MRGGIRQGAQENEYGNAITDRYALGHIYDGRSSAVSEGCCRCKGADDERGARTL